MSTSPSESSQISKKVPTDGWNEEETVEEKDQLTEEKNEETKDSAIEDLMARMSHLADLTSLLSQVTIDIPSLEDDYQSTMEKFLGIDTGSKKEVVGGVTSERKLGEGQSSSQD